MESSGGPTALLASVTRPPVSRVLMCQEQSCRAKQSFSQAQLPMDHGPALARLARLAASAARLQASSLSKHPLSSRPRTSLVACALLLASVPPPHAFAWARPPQSADPSLDATESEELLSKVDVLQGMFQILAVTTYLALWVRQWPQFCPEMHHV